jgi:hypothetical protein
MRFLIIYKNHMASNDVASIITSFRKIIKKMERPKMSFFNDKRGYNISRFFSFIYKFI